MSIQLNYYAMGEDAVTVAELILKVFPDLHWIPERGPAEIVKPAPVRKSEDLLPTTPVEKYLLVPSQYVELLRTQPLSKGGVIIHTDESPVIEYRPSFCEDPQTVRRGRLYYEFGDSPELKKEVQRLFRYLRKASKAEPPGPGARVFPFAEANATYFRQVMNAPLERNDMAEHQEPTD